MLYRKCGSESETIIVKTDPFQDPSASITQKPEKYPDFSTLTVKTIIP